MSRYVFSRVPGYDTWVGDKRVRANQKRTEFVCFVIDLDTMKGQGFRSSALPEAKAAAEHFTQKFEFPKKKA